MENLLQKYVDELKAELRPANVTLARFYGELFHQEITTRIYTTFGKLIKLYGRERVLNAVLDMYDIEDLNHKNIYPLLSYLIKKRLNLQIKPDVVLLSDTIQSIRKELNKNRGIERIQYLE